ncbi:uncharacterized protein [Nicotiana sylvestris]|uniref:uncharacterized protein n=1 Tax=Nicotiana sylvestris TaxID=4096 RepID=UPI00388CA41E
MGRSLIYSERNEIKFRVNDEEVTFQVIKGMKLPHEYESISVIDVVDEVEDAVEMKMEEQCLGEALAAILVNFDGEDMKDKCLRDVRRPTLCSTRGHVFSWWIGIVLGNKISKYGIEVDRAKIEIISKLPPPTSVKGV